MRELVRQQYPRFIYPEHPDFHAYYPGGGGYTGYAFSVGYARAMLQAALDLS